MPNAQSTIVETVTKTVTAGVLAAFAIALPASLAAQQAVAPKAKPTPAAPVAAAAAEEESAAPVDKPSQQGIKVHGHWVLDLKDKDGKVVGHRDFQNSLTAQGGATIANLLLGLSSAGGFEVAAEQEPGIGGFMSPSGQFFNYNCVPSSTYSCNTNLTQKEVAGQVVLNGSFVAASALTIRTVSTYLGYCGAFAGSGTAPTTYSPVSCLSVTNGASSNISTFTGTALASPLPMVAGQTLAITVTLSFS